MVCFEGIAAAIVVVWAALAAGMRVAERSRCPGRLDMAVRSLGLGYLLVSYATFGLGLVGLLSPLSLGLLLTAALFVSGRAWRVWPLLVAAWNELRARLDSRLVEVVLVLALAGITVSALAPNTNYDVEAYHYAFPAIYLRHGSTRWSGVSFFEGLVQATEMLYIPCLALGGEVAANLLGVTFLLLLLAGAVQLCHRAQPRAPAYVAVLLVSSPVILFQSLGGMVDLPAAAYSCLALDSLLRARFEAGHGYWCGVWSGATVATKLAALANVACLLVAAPFVVPRGARMRTVAVIALGVLVMGSPWWIRNDLATGDPFSPLGQWGMTTSVAHGARLAGQPKQRSFSSTFPLLLLRPDGGNRRWQRVVNPLVWAALVLLPILRPGMDLVWLGIPCALAVCGFTWASLSDLRYLLPTLAWLACLSAIILARARRRDRTRWAIAVACALSVAPGVLVWVGLMARRVPVVAGLESRESFLEQRGPQAAYRFLGHHARPGARALLLDRRGFRCPIDYRLAGCSARSAPPIQASRFRYMVMDLRYPAEMNAVLAAVAQDSSGRPLSLSQLKVGPLAELTSDQLSRAVRRAGYWTTSDGRVRLPGAPTLSGLAELARASLHGMRLVFCKDEVVVMASGNPQVSGSALGTAMRSR